MTSSGLKWCLFQKKNTEISLREYASTKEFGYR